MFTISKMAQTTYFEFCQLQFIKWLCGMYIFYNLYLLATQGVGSH